MASVYINLPALSVGSVTVTGVAQETTLQSILTEVQSINAQVDGVLTGSYAEIAGLTTVQTFTAPANAVGGNIMNVGEVNLRYKQGAVATASSGLRLEPGRSEVIQNATNISVCSEGAATDVCIIWNIKP